MLRLLRVMLLVAVFLVAFGVPAVAQTTNADNYTPVSVGGTSAVRVGGASAGRLPFTGSNDTPSFALVGIGAIALGAVMVVAAQRRSQVAQRA